MEVNVEVARATVDKIKVDVERMKQDAKPGDQLPAEVLFILLDSMIPVMDKLIEKLEEKESE